jgi:glycosyltransferase involved in cell wall biosynthesis
LEQTYADLEIILVNDASPDDSISKARNIIATSDRKEQVKIISHSENKGLSATRNAGVRDASGEYVYFLDGDDFLLPYSIASLVGYTQESPDIVCGDFKILSGYPINFPQLAYTDGTLLKGNDIRNGLFTKRWQQAACNKLVKRALFTEKGCWFEEGILHEDELWSLQISLSAQTMAICANETYVYRIRSGSITQLKSNKNFDSMEFIFQKMVDLFDKNKIEVSEPLYIYIMDQQIFLFKELIRYGVSKEKTAERIKKVGTIFSKYDKFNLRYPLRSNLQLLAYKLPSALAYTYVKAFV